MPRSADYYQNQNQSPASLPVQSAPSYQSPLIVNSPAPAAPKPKDILHDPQAKAELDRATNRGFWSFFGEGLRDTITGQKFVGESDAEASQRLSQNWDDMSTWDKAKSWAGGSTTFVWNYAKSMPANIIKGGVNLAYDAAEAVDGASHAIFGTKQIVPESYDLANLYRNAKFSQDPIGWVLDRTNFLGGGGQVSGFRLTYREARDSVRNAAYIGPTSEKFGVDKFFGALMTTGKVIGDALIGNMIRQGVSGAFKPRATVVENLGTTQDIRPMTPDTLSQVKMKVSDLTGGKYKPTITFDQNANGVMVKIAPQASEAMGLKGNYALRFTPAGEGLVNADVIQLQNSVVSEGLNWLKGKFGSNNIVQTEMGPGVKVRSGLVKYDPGVITAAGDAPPEFLAAPKATAPQLAVPATAAALSPAANSAFIELQGLMRAEPGTQIPVTPEQATHPVVQELEKAGLISTEGGTVQMLQPTAPAGAPSPKLQVAQAGGALELGKEFQVPTVVQPPLKGFADAPITPQQMGQLTYLQQQRGIDSMTMFSINQAITGKNNLADLTQKQAFDLSETLRLFNQPELNVPMDSSVPSFLHPARYWVDPGIYYGVENGYRLANQLNKQMDAADQNMLGKYADPKYVEERRMITNYAEGNSDAILKNPTLDEATKAELMKIGDAVKEKFVKLFEEGNLQAETYLGQYIPHIKKLSDIMTRFKDLENIPELKPFFEFMRKGGDTPLEDDIATIMRVYNKAFTVNKFLREPFNAAKEKMQQMSPAERRAHADYLQEKLGYQGQMEQYVQKWGLGLSKLSGGAIKPKSLMGLVNWAMKNSYAATLGFRPMAVFSQLVQAMVMNYAEFGNDMWHGFGKLLDSKATEEFRASGFLPERGVQEDPGVTDMSALQKTGNAIVGAYDKLQDFSLKGFSWGDRIGRQSAYFNTLKRFNDNWQLFQKGQISYGDFEKNISMSGYSPALQGIVRSKLMKNTAESIKEARDLLTMQTLDSNFVPSRKGTESRAFYGLKGRTGLQFASYPFEMAHTIGDWIKRSQWDKLIRFLAMSTLIKRSADDVGINAKNALIFGSFASAPVGPLANAAFELLKIPFTKFSDEIDASWKNVADALTNYGGIATGVLADRIKMFKYSMDMYQKGHPQPDPTDPKKRFGIYSDASGKLKQTVTFGDLLKYGLNIPLSSTEDWSQRVSQETNATNARNKKIDEAVKAFVKGDYEKFNQIVVDNQLPISDLQTKIQSYDVPLDRRLYDRMPIDLKMRFYPLFFPNQ